MPHKKRYKKKRTEYNPSKTGRRNLTSFTENWFQKRRRILIWETKVTILEVKRLLVLKISERDPMRIKRKLFVFWSKLLLLWMFKWLLLEVCTSSWVAVSKKFAQNFHMDTICKEELYSSKRANKHLAHFSPLPYKWMTTSLSEACSLRLLLPKESPLNFL